MKPEEFTKLLRGRARTDIDRAVRVAREAVGENNQLVEAKLERFMVDPGDALARAGVIPRASAPRVNNAILAIYKSATIHRYLRKLEKIVKSDSSLQASMKRLGEQGQLPPGELDQSIGKLLEDDRFLTKAVKATLDDPEVRKALGIPREVTFDTYVQNVRKQMKSARTLDEVLTAASCGGPLADDIVAFCTATICVGVVSVVTLAAVVHTVIGAVNYLFVYAVAANAAVVKWQVAVTAAGATLPGFSGDWIPTSDADVESKVVNESSVPVWVVVGLKGGFRRVPLPPGKSTTGLGLPVVEAILIGGELNRVTALQTSAGVQRAGAYVIWKCPGTPGVVTIRDGEGCLIAEANDPQADGERAGLAGHTDLRGGGSAGTHYDRRFHMAGVAAAVPEGFDFTLMMNDAIDAEHFYRTLRFLEISQCLKGDDNA